MQLHFYIPNDLEMPMMKMNFTYIYADDPDNDILSGNITWRIPDTQQPAHWVHAERICKLMVGWIHLKIVLPIWFLPINKKDKWEIYGNSST